MVLLGTQSDMENCGYKNLHQIYMDANNSFIEHNIFLRIAKDKALSSDLRSLSYSHNIPFPFIIDYTTQYICAKKVFYIMPYITYSISGFVLILHWTG